MYELISHGESMKGHRLHDGIKKRPSRRAQSAERPPFCDARAAARAHACDGDVNIYYATPARGTAAAAAYYRP
ncbi:hypothetical protein EVAR_49716_1 [Eumeta japonica]|uniref:Uncharacterized protein n=1 Tax=Eumeta variegata TaxID=151549 RepID=A0A4C1Z723_EUMVA|nr:hypothetical protein EVAR_49716_1 [Eumeta japonica]